MHIEVETVIIGYHVYKEIWTATLGEVLTCRRETDNFHFHDRFAVAAMKGSDVVGHVPKKLSTICSLCYVLKVTMQIILQILLRFSIHLTASTIPYTRSSV